MVYKANMQAAAQRAEVSEHERESRSLLWRPKKGVNVIRILPPWSAQAADAGVIDLLTYEHWIGKKNYPCPKQTWPDQYETCPICDVLADLEAKGVGKAIERMRASPKTAVPAIIRKSKDGFKEDVVKIATCTITFHNWLMQQLTPEGQEAVGDFLDLESGFDVQITRKTTNEGSQERTRYEFSWVPKGRPAASADLLKRLGVDDAEGIVSPDLDKAFQISESQYADIEAAARSLSRRMGGDEIGDDETAAESGIDEGEAASEGEADPTVSTDGETADPELVEEFVEESTETATEEADPEADPEPDPEPTPPPARRPAAPPARAPVKGVVAGKPVAAPARTVATPAGKPAAKPPAAPPAKAPVKGAAKPKGSVSGLPGPRDRVAGEPAEPKIDPDTGKPVCFLRYLDRGNPRSGPASHPECAVCKVSPLCKNKSINALGGTAKK